MSIVKQFARYKKLFSWNPSLSLFSQHFLHFHMLKQNQCDWSWVSVSWTDKTVSSPFRTWNAPKPIQEIWTVRKFVSICWSFHWYARPKEIYLLHLLKQFSRFLTSG
jgi:hypothetical protein